MTEFTVPRFRVVDAAMMRVAAWPVCRHLDAGPPAADAGPGMWQRWAQRLGHDGDLLAAIELVSPSLAAQVRKVAAGTRLRPNQYGRLGAAVTRYRSRMTRATPLGLFAGVAAARFGAPWVPGPGAARSVIRPGAEWLDAVIAELEQTPRLLLRVRVVADDTVFVRDGRLVLPWARVLTDATASEPPRDKARPDMWGGLSSGQGEAVSTTVAVDTASVGRMSVGGGERVGVDASSV